ncbi:hypothetical protein HNQ55_003035 [Thalassotalea piscium]|uniref:Uncharacterized protein n=1 Tax=Thalassotalea piscium TaxID=1230533 RepID=A0A7X0TUL5_9GAMM|nr:hypothetical protein [Thalassotalea piscium]
MLGKVVAGAKGFKSHYYYKRTQPFSFYFFVFIYFFIGIFLVSQFA